MSAAKIANHHIIAERERRLIMTITANFEGYKGRSVAGKAGLLFRDINTGRSYTVPMVGKYARFPRDIPEGAVFQLEGNFFWSKSRFRWEIFVESYEETQWPEVDDAVRFVYDLHVENIGIPVIKALTSITGPDVYIYLLLHPDVDDLADQVNAITNCKPFKISGDHIDKLREKTKEKIKLKQL